MRIDKFIQITRLIKSRKYSKEACERGLVYVNGKKVKASYRVKEGDRIILDLFDRRIELVVNKIPEKNFKKEEILDCFEILSYEKKKVV